jgi:hypothetical protein
MKNLSYLCLRVRGWMTSEMATTCTPQARHLLIYSNPTRRNKETCERFRSVYPRLWRFC